MTYELVYTRHAERDLKKLDPALRARIGQALLRFAQAPLDHAERLTASKLGSYRFRIGDYRVVFDLEGSQIVVLRVGHRREIYRRG